LPPLNQPYDTGPPEEDRHGDKEKRPVPFSQCRGMHGDSGGYGGSGLVNRPMQQHGIRLPHVAQKVPGGEAGDGDDGTPADKVTGRLGDRARDPNGNACMVPHPPKAGAVDCNSAHSSARPQIDDTARHGGGVVVDLVGVGIAAPLLDADFHPHLVAGEIGLPDFASLIF
jgi:hypothetical protein